MYLLTIMLYARCQRAIGTISAHIPITSVAQLKFSVKYSFDKAKTELGSLVVSRFVVVIKSHLNKN